MGTTSCCSLSKNTDTNTHSRARARSNNLISTYFEIGTLQIKYKKKIVVEKNNKTIDHTFFFIPKMLFFSYRVYTRMPLYVNETAIFIYTIRFILHVSVF